MKQNQVKKQNKNAKNTPSYGLFVKIVAGICASLIIGSLFTCLIR